MGAICGSQAALISILSPPMCSSSRSDTCASVRRTGLGGRASSGPMPDIPIAVGTQAG